MHAMRTLYQCESYPQPYSYLFLEHLSYQEGIKAGRRPEHGGISQNQGGHKRRELEVGNSRRKSSETKGEGLVDQWDLRGK